MTLAALTAGCGGSDLPAGAIEGARRSRAALARAEHGQQQAIEALTETAPPATADFGKRILFGDLHVHTTYSVDAFLLSLPLVGGDGAHPPSDACDYARHCSALDFYALTDHASSLTPEHWQASKESVRQCNAIAGDPSDPDLVAFMGFEWTQSGSTPRTHFGHRNVIFPGDRDEQLPVRPINAGGLSGLPPAVADRIWRGALLDPVRFRYYRDFGWLLDRLSGLERCDPFTPSPELGPDCLETARTPGVLHRKLEEWGLDPLIIPHGTAWGMNTPPMASLDNHLTRAAFDPERERLIEVMSGHGSSEEFRPWRSIELRDAPGGTEKVCPEPSPGFLPCCWRAGEIVRERCGDLPEEKCEARVQAARQRAIDEGTRLFPKADWLDCDQCRDCFKPAYGYRPRSTVQYAMALSNFDEPDEDGAPLRHRYGFVASSDDHSGRAASGYKQIDRFLNTDARGARSAFAARHIGWKMPERAASFLYPGGAVAVHAEGRSREAVWDALQRREAYGTSGPRILLWFDLVNESAGSAAMGSELWLDEAPHFEVRAIGAFEQRPGCSEASAEGLPPERLERLCGGECYNPADTRHPIAAIEVVRILPQQRSGEPVESLVEDPWRRFDCAPDPAGCAVRFQDEDFPALGRDALYYVRALQSPTPAINGANLRAKFDAEGRAVSARPCFGDYRTPADDDCLAPVMERAWSSPIFVNHERARARRLRDPAETPG